MFPTRFLASAIIVIGSATAAAAAGLDGELRTTEPVERAEPVYEPVDCNDRRNQEDPACLALPFSLGSASLAATPLLLLGGAVGLVAIGGDEGGSGSSTVTTD